jgi:hypothetical protein
MGSEFKAKQDAERGVLCSQLVKAFLGRQLESEDPQNFELAVGYTASECVASSLSVDPRVPNEWLSE